MITFLITKPYRSPSIPFIGKIPVFVYEPTSYFYSNCIGI